MPSPALVIAQTKKWIDDVVVGCNFCPFAAKVVEQKQIHYAVEISGDSDQCMEAMLSELCRLDENAFLETSFLIFPNAFSLFDDFLDLLSLAESLLKQNAYDGIYQLASFHPLYLFAGSDENDAANYTNRSIYPMLHILRESSIDKVMDKYKNPENIPGININLTREKGLIAMIKLRDSCVLEHEPKNATFDLSKQW